MFQKYDSCAMQPIQVLEALKDRRWGWRFHSAQCVTKLYLIQLRQGGREAEGFVRFLANQGSKSKDSPDVLEEEFLERSSWRFGSCRLNLARDVKLIKPSLCSVPNEAVGFDSFEKQAHGILIFTWLFSHGWFTKETKCHLILLNHTEKSEPSKFLFPAWPTWTCPLARLPNSAFTQIPKPLALMWQQSLYQCHG